MNTDILLASNNPLIIDGGLSNVLEEQGCDLNHKLWTANLLDKNPEAIVTTHFEYLKAGAQCITTSSYQASIPGLTALGYNKADAQKLILKSIELAELAIQKGIQTGDITDKPLIAASVGPYGAYLADGSEYRGDYNVSDEKLKEFHLERILLLERSKADLLACETIPSLQEAIVLSDILARIEKPSWLSFSCRDAEHLNDGSKIEECVAVFRNHPKVFAIGVNCTHPKYISPIIRRIKTCQIEKRIVVYPNSGQAYNAETKTWGGLSDPDHFVEMSKEWVNLGADIIGGCCRIGPGHIRSLKRAISDSKSINQKKT